MAEKVVIGNAELWHGDCREVLPLLPRFDLVLNDPPFGMGNFVQTTGRLMGRAFTGIERERRCDGAGGIYDWDARWAALFVARNA
jgi:hypothetical protein